MLDHQTSITHSHGTLTSRNALTRTFASCYHPLSPQLSRDHYHPLSRHSHRSDLDFLTLSHGVSPPAGVSEGKAPGGPYYVGGPARPPETSHRAWGLWPHAPTSASAHHYPAKRAHRETNT